MSEEWGVGKETDAKAFDVVEVGKEQVELIFGEHPHSRRDNTVYARWENGTIEGFNGHRLIHEIKFKDHNYLKTSGLSGNEVRKGGNCEIYINNFLVETFFYRDVQWALLYAHSLIDKIHEHPIRLWDKKERDELVGRKVYWDNFPAKITSFIEDQACVILEPDNEDGENLFPLSPYEKEDLKEGQLVDDESKYTIKDSIYSPHIWWWRT